MIASSFRCRRGAIARLGILAVLGGGAVLGVTGCGSSASSATAAGTEGPVAPGPIVESKDKVSQTGSSEEIVTGKFPSGHDTDETSVTGAKPLKPCTLVTVAQANQILGGGATKVERPQGPTCVFVGSGRQISLIVDQARLNPLVHGARSAKPIVVSGKKGWCIRYQSSSVVFNVGRGRVLQITGPCAAGVRFAASALPRIP
jgi:hypothetical protein